jgi:hypothetical protein
MIETRGQIGLAESTTRAWQGIIRIFSIPVVAVAAIAFLGRLPWIGDPVLLDADTYLTVARAWLDGLVPYQDVFAEKGPIVYAFFAGVEAVAPASLFAVRVAFMLVVVAAAVPLVALVQRHAGRRVAWAAAVVYAMACSSSLWEASFDVNTELLGLPFMIAAVDLADRYSGSGRWWQAAGAGATLAGSFWVKPSIAFIGPLILALLVLRPDRRLLGVALAGVGAVAASAATLAPFIAADALDSMRWSLTTYQRGYVSGGFEDFGARGLHSQIAWIFNAAGSAFFVAALTLGLLSWVLERHRRLVAICTAWFVLEYVGVKLGVRDYPHYFVSVLPPCAILLCVGADAVADHLSGLEGRGRTALLVAAWLSLATFLILGPSIGRLQTGEDPRHALIDDVSDVVKEVTSKDERIFVAANETGYQVYWLSDRNPATRFFWAELMGALPYSFDRDYVTEAERDLERNPPDAVVIWPNSLAAADNYLRPAIESGGLRQVAAVPTAVPGDVVRVYGRR